MRERPSACALAVSFAITSLTLTALASNRQANATAQQSEKSSTPDIRWEFDTHG
jgi:hypothetical protein